MKTKLKYHESIGALEISVQCPTCEEYEAPLTLQITEYDKWRAGTPVQAAFPNLSASQREILTYGTCTRCLLELAEERKAEESDKIEKHMEGLGYHLIETGGHCTAFYKKNSSGQLELITDIGGCGVPTSWYEPVIVGLYASQDDWDNGISNCEDYRSLRHFLDREL
jgi:hypothetical protein